jgi:hypothetical protein
MIITIILISYNNTYNTGYLIGYYINRRPVGSVGLLYGRPWFDSRQDQHSLMGDIKEPVVSRFNSSTAYSNWNIDVLIISHDCKLLLMIVSCQWRHNMQPGKVLHSKRIETLWNALKLHKYLLLLLLLLFESGSISASLVIPTC